VFFPASSNHARIRRILF
jgi:hypothetical protein